MSSTKDNPEKYVPVRGLCHVRDARLTPLKEKIKIMTLFLTQKETETDAYSVFLFKGKKVVFIPDKGTGIGTFYYIPEGDYKVIIKE